jgi:HEAT repeat protein
MRDYPGIDVGPHGVEEALTRAVSDPDPGVRLAAVESLGNLKCHAPVTVTALIGALNDSRSEVGMAAETSLYQIKDATRGDSRVDQQLVEVVRRPDSTGNYLAAKALGIRHTQHPEAPALIASLLAVGHPDFVRYDAANALGHLDPSSIPADVILTLAGSLKTDPSHKVKWTAATSLGEIGNANSSVISALEEAMDIDGDLRGAAKEALSKLGHDPAKAARIDAADGQRPALPQSSCVAVPGRRSFWASLGDALKGRRGNR